MQHEALGTLSPAVIKYIKALEASVQEYQYKYLFIKEQYDVLIYKRFARSAEQLCAEEKQQWLFSEEVEQAAAGEEKGKELQSVASYSRKKPGRKPLDPNLPRVERIVDIPESEKTCACGAALTRIGEETNERLHIIPPKLFVEKTIRPK